MAVDDGEKRDAGALSPGSNPEKIFVLREEDSVERGRSIENVGIRCVPESVVGSRQNIDAGGSKGCDNCTMDIVIHVKGNSHEAAEVP